MPAKGIEGRYIIDFEGDIQIEDKGKLSVTITLPEAGIFKPVPVETDQPEFLYQVQ